MNQEVFTDVMKADRSQAKVFSAAGKVGPGGKVEGGQLRPRVSEARLRGYVILFIIVVVALGIAAKALL